MTLRIPTDAQCEVRAVHMRQLPALKRLLLELNDAYTSAGRITRLVEDVPILAGRCVRRAMLQSPGAPIDTLEQVLNLIGNQSLEGEILTLLEDLTVLKADLEESGKA